MLTTILFEEGGVILLSLSRGQLGSRCRSLFIKQIMLASRVRYPFLFSTNASAWFATAAPGVVAQAVAPTGIQASLRQLLSISYYAVSHWQFFPSPSVPPYLTSRRAIFNINIAMDWITLSKFSLLPMG